MLRLGDKGEQPLSSAILTNANRTRQQQAGTRQIKHCLFSVTRWEMDMT